MKTTQFIISTGAGVFPAQSLPVVVNRIYRSIPISLIVRIEGYGSYCRIFTRDGYSYTMTKNLVSLGRLVPAFWRVHRSHLVNPAYVRVSPGLFRRSGILTLLTEDYIRVARRRQEEVYQKLKQFQL